MVRSAGSTSRVTGSKSATSWAIRAQARRAAEISHGVLPIRAVARGKESHMRSCGSVSAGRCQERSVMGSFLVSTVRAVSDEPRRERPAWRRTTPMRLHLPW